MHPISQLAFDLDDAPVAPTVVERRPGDLPDLDRESAVRKLATLIARYHAAEGSADDHQ